MKAFLLKFGAMISLVLSGSDRLRFRGESRMLNNVRGLDSYLYALDLFIQALGGDA